MRRMILTAGLLLSLSSVAMASQVYKWVDAQGITHFGAQPPQGQSATEIDTATVAPKAPTPSATVPAAAAAAAAAAKSSDDQKAIDAKVKQQVAQQEDERKQQCDQTRTNLAQLQINTRLLMEVNGETKRLTEEERQAKIAEAQQNIKDNCE